MGIRDRAGGRGECSLESQPRADDWLLATLTACIVNWVCRQPTSCGLNAGLRGVERYESNSMRLDQDGKETVELSLTPPHYHPGASLNW